MTEKVVLIGAGGHARSVIGVIEAGGEFNIHGLIDGAFPAGHHVLGHRVLGGNELLEQLNQDKDIRFLITVGQVSAPTIRVRLFEMLAGINARLLSRVTAPTAFVSPHTVIGKGTVIMHQSVVNAGADIGDNVIINNCALVEHDAVIGSHTHISTGALVNGGCRVGDRVFIGSGAVLVHGVSITSDVIVGAGAVVISSITEPGTYVGNPARKISL